MNIHRLVSALFIICCTLHIAVSVQLNKTDYDIEDKLSGQTDIADIDSISQDVTVVSTQGTPLEQNGDVVAFTTDGKIVYHESRFRNYFDIYVKKNKRYTIEYSASKVINNCSKFNTQKCTKNMYIQANMSTGDRKLVYSEITPSVQYTRWHDATPYNETHILVGSITYDGVFIVNRDTGQKRWLWNATRKFEKPQSIKRDWTHLNDVELLKDKTILVSLRNQDQIIFLEKRNNAYYENKSMTLGEDDKYNILYEQHNPDYIPKDRGGPALVIGDSENNRVVEYQYRSGKWHQSLTWRDLRTQWPRDADRLTNKETLITDSNGERVLVIDDDGYIQNSYHIQLPYEAERLSFAETQNREALSNANFNAKTGVERMLIQSKDFLPRSLINGILFISDSWLRYQQLVSVIFTIGLLFLIISHGYYLRAK
jgi:hypothetical protein